MAHSTALTGSGLVSIALVIRSRDGPRFVFHYPAHPDTKTSRRTALYGTELDESDAEDETLQADGADLEDGALAGKVQNLDMSEVAEKRDHVGHIQGDDHYDTKHGEHVVPWERLFDFHTTDLESILTPSKVYHKKKFELSLDPLYFVSYPMHVHPHGLWNKKKPKRGKQAKGVEGDMAGSGRKKSDLGHGDRKERSASATWVENTSENEDDHGGMTMFNIVFILNVAKDEADERIFMIYEHVIKKLNKAMKHAQATANYVWKESEMILSMKEKAREDSTHTSQPLWNHTLMHLKGDL